MNLEGTWDAESREAEAKKTRRTPEEEIRLGLVNAMREGQVPLTTHGASVVISG